MGTGSAFAQTPSPTPTPAPSSAPPQQATPTERAAAEVRPAIVYLTEKFTGYVVDQDGKYFNNGNAYELSVTCTGFGVNPDGYIATAGHCVDISSPNGIRSEFIAAAAKEAIIGVPGVTLQQAVDFGNANWAIEGQAKGSPIDTQIAVVTGSLQGGGKGQALPARVVDARPLDQGDVALLKVETTDLPSVELASDADVQIGTPLLSIGYPASADAVTDPTLEPTNKDGQVSSKKTVGSVPVYETSAALTPGMSGGPTVDLNGRVLGVNSFMPSGESQAFNFIAPSAGLSELLSRNGVHNELGAADKAFRAALDDYYAGHYTAAIAGFDKLLQVAPEHAQATQFRTLAAKARERFGDTPVAPAPAPSSGLPLDLSPLAFWSIIGGGAALTLGLGVLVLRRGNKQDAVTLPPGLPPTPFPGYGTVASQAPAPAPAWLGTTSRDATVDLSMLNGPANGTTPAPGAVLTAPRENCTRCGMRLAAEAHFCPTCGQARS
jgi:S1-C subfamily serine protease